MFTEERLEQILEMLNKNGRVKVKELSEFFNVSESMIRKDLQRLESEQLLQRTYGGAILKRKFSESSPISTRLKEHADTKELIAAKAFGLISDGDVVFLESSSINYYLAKLIADSTKKITLITNMSIIPSLFNDNETVKLICIGGIYDRKAGGVLGSEVIKGISKYIFNKGFVGSAGIDLTTNSAYTVTPEDGNVKELVISNSKEAFLLVEKEKFDVDSTYRFAALQEFNAVITDSDISEGIREKMQQLSVKLI